MEGQPITAWLRGHRLGWLSKPWLGRVTMFIVLVLTLIMAASEGPARWAWAALALWTAAWMVLLAYFADPPGNVR